MNAEIEKNQSRIPEKEIYADKAEADKYAAASSRGLFNLMERNFADLILNRFSGYTYLNVLDMGTGPGWIPLALAKAKPHWTIHAVDASPPMLAIARQNADRAGVKINWIQAGAEKTGLPDGHFDLVISHFSFHEFPQAEKVMTEARRVLAEHGQLLVRDMRRPSTMYPLIKVLLNAYYRSNLPMYKQVTTSLEACYRANELEALARDADFMGFVTSPMVCGMPMIQYQGKKL